MHTDASVKLSYYRDMRCQEGLYLIERILRRYAFFSGESKYKLAEAFVGEGRLRYARINKGVIRKVHYITWIIRFVLLLE